ncbi:Transposase [Phytophthora megakarya]|uniref:Transposase n=1 Tax=Phytophthora megakarya TaxID=4795 RepID=A0A225V969_9STRA|nr:Transposase [Phytophthora megakarya]
MQKYEFIRFVAVVTDNTLANRNAWKILRKKYPEVFFHGCAAHI